MVWTKTSKLALKTNIWAVNLFMKALIFSMGRVKIIKIPNLIREKKSILLLEFWEKGFEESCHKDEWQIFKNLFSLDLKQHTKITIKLNHSSLPGIQI